MTVSSVPDPNYRPCVGIMLFNSAGEVFVGQRKDMAEAAWQMPQGGIDPGETPAQAALRELEEEIGTAAAEILAETDRWMHYDLPEDLRGRIWGGKYRGQAQKWVLARFTGVDNDINIATEHPEFSEWRWLAPDALEANIVSFKREIYAEVVRAFSGLIRLNAES